MTPYFQSEDKNFALYQGDCIDILSAIGTKFDMIFADPPYFLSNGGISVHSGKMVCVNKGDWDKSNGFDEDNNFNYNWIKACREVLSDNGTIWVCGTYHNIFSVAQMLNELDFKILNCITWNKTNPPPNLSCKYFTHSTEFIIWARKSAKRSHYFNYELMKGLNDGKQMKDVWVLPSIGAWEKTMGKHPTQKPLSVLSRIVLSSTCKNNIILDPFCGSSTTGIAANLFGRRYVGIDTEVKFLSLSQDRYFELQSRSSSVFLDKIKGIDIEIINTFDK